LFPEAKDIGGADFRKNLITVPSCEEHNCKKSKDDEFLMVSIAGILGNNSIGYRHSRNKVDRALKRSAYKLLDKVFLRKEFVRVEQENNKFLDILIGTPDYQRLISCFSHIALGVYRQHFRENFTGQIKSHLGFLHNKANNPNVFNGLIKHKVSLELAEVEKSGHNPKVFYYQFTQPDQFGIFLVKMCFYDGVDVYTAFMPETAENPHMLAMDFIKSGIKTIVKLDGREYEFN